MATLISYRSSLIPISNRSSFKIHFFWVQQTSFNTNPPTTEDTVSSIRIRVESQGGTWRPRRAKCHINWIELRLWASKSSTPSISLGPPKSSGRRLFIGNVMLIGCTWSPCRRCPNPAKQQFWLINCLRYLLGLWGGWRG